MPLNKLVTHHPNRAVHFEWDSEDSSDDEEYYCGHVSQCQWPDLPTRKRHPRPLRYPTPEPGVDQQSAWLSIAGPSILIFIQNFMRLLGLLPPPLTEDPEYDSDDDEEATVEDILIPPGSRLAQEDLIEYDSDTVILPFPDPDLEHVSYMEIEVIDTVTEDNLRAIKKEDIFVYRVLDRQLGRFERLVMSLRLHAYFMEGPSGNEIIPDYRGRRMDDMSEPIDDPYDGALAETWFVIGGNWDFVRQVHKLSGGKIPPWPRPRRPHFGVHPALICFTYFLYMIALAAMAFSYVIMQRHSQHLVAKYLENPHRNSTITFGASLSQIPLPFLGQLSK